MKFVKICVICGNKFETTTWNKSVCSKDHYHPCPVCGTDVLCNDPKRQNSACSRKCGQVVGNESRVRTNLAKYGVENVSQINEVRDKISAKLKEVNPKQPKKYKCCEVCGKQFELKWPYDQHTCSSKCRGEYRRRTGISTSIYEKASNTNLSRYGVRNQGERPEVHKQMEDTMEERYGVRYARYVPEIEDRVKQTCMERYGVPYYIQTEDANRNNVYRISKLNRDFSEYLTNNRVVNSLEKYLDGKFYDVVVESQNCVMELDPTYTHNNIGNHWNSAGLPEDYHKNKSETAKEAGYRCIHVFDWDDWDKIADLLKEKTTIYARSCDIQSISKQEANKFTSLYHVSGKCNGQNLNYGLYYGDELVEVMTFGKPRYNKRYDYELLRLCSKSDVRVIGGASKLFKQFIREHPECSVISYCDLSKFTGDVYEKIGMTFLETTPPNKVWSKENKKVTQNLLNQRGYDQLFKTNYGKGTSNEQLMLQNGWLPVYDCGQAVYEYKNC